MNFNIPSFVGSSNYDGYTLNVYLGSDYLLPISTINDILRSRSVQISTNSGKIWTCYVNGIITNQYLIEVSMLLLLLRNRGVDDFTTTLVGQLNDITELIKKNNIANRTKTSSNDAIDKIKMIEKKSTDSTSDPVGSTTNNINIINGNVNINKIGPESGALRRVLPNIDELKQLALKIAQNPETVNDLTDDEIAEMHKYLNPEIAKVIKTLMYYGSHIDVYEYRSKFYFSIDELLSTCALTLASSDGELVPVSKWVKLDLIESDKLIRLLKKLGVIDLYEWVAFNVGQIRGNCAKLRVESEKPQSNLDNVQDNNAMNLYDCIMILDKKLTNHMCNLTQIGRPIYTNEVCGWVRKNPRHRGESDDDYCCRYWSAPLG
jgi:hypothetical protein